MSNSSADIVLPRKESLESFKSQAPYKLGMVVAVSKHSTWDVKTERYEFKVILSSIWSWETNLRQAKTLSQKTKDEKKTLRMVVHTFNYSTHETEAGK